MDRILGIDYGRKRCGVAVSDPLGVFASALCTVHSAKLIDYIKNYTESNPVARIVVGWPVNMDGSPSEAQADVEAFLKQLGKHFPDLPVDKEDERFTSVLAHRAMIDGGMPYEKRRDKTSVDKISAAIILQSWLDRANGQGPDGFFFDEKNNPSEKEAEVKEPKLVDSKVPPKPKKRKLSHSPDDKRS